MSHRMTIALRRVAPTAVLSLVLGACAPSPSLAGDEVSTRSFPVTAFSAVSVGFPAEFDIRSSNRNLLTVTAEPKVIAAIRIGVQSGRLSLNADSFRTVRPIRVRLEGTSINSVMVSSAASVEIRDLKAEKLAFESNSAADISISGVTGEHLRLGARESASIRISGRVSTVELTAAGSSEIDARQLQAGTADVSAADASTVQVRAGRELRANASGSASIRYHGRSPSTQRIADAAEVVRAD